MTIKTVLLHSSAETTEPRRSVAGYAIGLAGAFNAHLQALVLQLDVITPKGAVGRQITADARARIRQRNEDVGVVAGDLRDVAREQGVEAQVITDRSYIHSTPEIAADRGRLVDLIVAGICDEGLLSERMVAEALIFQSGRPVILVPDAHDGDYRADRIVVAWDFSRVAARALADALPFLLNAGEVSVIAFGDDKDFTSSVGKDDVLAALSRRGVSARYETRKRGDRTIGEALNATVAERRADLLVMGGFGHSRFRDFVLGGATRTMLAAPAVPTLISH